MANVNFEQKLGFDHYILISYFANQDSHLVTFIEIFPKI